MASEVSDGYHTFAELYEHRHALWLAVCRFWSGYSCVVWRSKLHADGTMFDDSFILGIHKAPGSQITYHLPLRLWDAADFADTLDCAPPYDGHTSADVVERINHL